MKPKRRIGDPKYSVGDLLKWQHPKYGYWLYGTVEKIGEKPLLVYHYYFSGHDWVGEKYITLVCLAKYRDDKQERKMDKEKLEKQLGDIVTSQGPSYKTTLRDILTVKELKEITDKIYERIMKPS